MLRQTLILILLVLGTSSVLATDAEGPRGFVMVNSVADLNERLANADGQIVALRFSADWSITDGEMDKIYASAGVLKLLTDVVLLEIDITDNTRGHMVLLEKYDIVGAPWMIFFGKNGERIEKGDIAGYQPEHAVVEHLKTLLVAEMPMDQVGDLSGRDSED